MAEFGMAKFMAEHRLIPRGHLLKHSRIRTIDPAVEDAAPKGTTFLDIIPGGSSYWDQTAYIEAIDPDGRLVMYFLKVSLSFFYIFSFSFFIIFFL